MLINVTPSDATDEVEQYLEAADRLVGLPAELRRRVRLATARGPPMGRAERSDPRGDGSAPLRDRHDRRRSCLAIDVLHGRPFEVPAG